MQNQESRLGSLETGLNNCDSVADPELCNQAASSNAPDTTSEHIPPDPARNAVDGSALLFDELDDDESSPESDALRKEWQDLTFTPLELARVACIPYTSEFRTAFGILLTARDLGEVSRRALNLCSNAIRLNPSDVTAWGYRRYIVRNMFAKADSNAAEQLLQDELVYSKQSIETAPKSYQLWEYRRFLRDLGSSNEEERVLIKDILAEDTKNYHAWSHLAWLASKSSLEEVESDMLYTADLVLLDVRNNSAWSHRWWLAQRACRPESSELDWALQQMLKAPRNESVWEYITALVRWGVRSEDSTTTMARSVLTSDPGNVPARRHVVLCGGCPLADRIAHCRTLADETDTQRSRYWTWKADRLK
jgi:protein farnesyltransferase/geranylgeranyltransferase type-1 subunit alpha